MKNPIYSSHTNVNGFGGRQLLAGRFGSALLRPLATVMAVISSAVAVHATTIDLSEAGNYNLLTWGDATLQNSDIQGSVAVGGNASFSGYSIGSQANNALPTDASFVVRGNLTAGSGQVNNGSIYVGGAYNGPGYNLNAAAGSVTQSGLGAAVPFNFATARTALTASSASYGAAAANGWIALGSTLTLTGTDSSLNIFNITAAQLAAANTLQINVAANSHVLINVSGTSAVFSNMGISGTATAADTLFNFYQATTLLMSSIGVEGSILAPLADVNFANGQMDGILIANSFTGGGELHNHPFNNQTPKSVPDSANTALLLLGGFGALALARKSVTKKVGSQ